MFKNANLDTIEGLAGVLSSAGGFEGPINRIEVQGITETPNFQVDAGGLPVPLKTRFTAVVDGSDGDTYLRQVDASFLDTSMTAQGAVIGLEGVPGRQVEVDVDMQNGRIEDLLKLAVRSDEPILRGAARLKAKLVIPPEKKKVIDKLQLRGEFVLSQAKFTDADGADEADRAEPPRAGHEPGRGGRRSAVEPARPLRRRECRRVTFSSLTFSVPGAAVELAGRYGLRDEVIAFKGKLKMQATLSQVAGGGVKGFFLKAFDGLFKEKDAGMVLPIKISGTRKNPKFGLDMF